MSIVSTILLWLRLYIFAYLKVFELNLLHLLYDFFLIIYFTFFFQFVCCCCACSFFFHWIHFYSKSAARCLRANCDLNTHKFWPYIMSRKSVPYSKLLFATNKQNNVCQNTTTTRICTHKKSPAMRMQQRMQLANTQTHCAVLIIGKPAN